MRHHTAAFHKTAGICVKTQIPVFIYSYLSASIGSRLDALTAG